MATSFFIFKCLDRALGNCSSVMTGLFSFPLKFSMFSLISLFFKVVFLAPREHILFFPSWRCRTYPYYQLMAHINKRKTFGRQYGHCNQPVSSYSYAAPSDEGTAHMTYVTHQVALQAC